MFSAKKPYKISFPKRLIEEELKTKTIEEVSKNYKEIALVRSSLYQYGSAETEIYDMIDLYEYRRKDDEGKKLPVLVYFHGGGFTAGDNKLYCNQMKLIAEKAKER